MNNNKNCFYPHIKLAGSLVLFSLSIYPPVESTRVELFPSSSFFSFIFPVTTDRPPALLFQSWDPGLKGRSPISDDSCFDRVHLLCHFSVTSFNPPNFLPLSLTLTLLRLPLFFPPPPCLSSPLMTSLDIEAATALKQQGNKAFTQHDWLAAVDFYTQAIEKYDHDPSFFSNRAQAHIKLESYGYAIADATKALELDPSYTKAYWRRALANTAILSPKEALKDFKSVVRKDPNNRDAKLKLAECEKLVRRIEFEKAIEVGEPPSAFEDLNIDGINVEDSYGGVRLGTEMTSEFIDDMIERFRNGKKIHRKYVFQIVKAVLEIVKAGPTMVEIKVEDGSKLTVCGDTHGQFFDLLEIFRLNGYPSETHAYLFNGDFVDRGSWSTEIALLLYAYKWLRPDRFFLNRGNHETDGMNRIYGFEGECKAKYNESVYKVFTESFAALPLATLIGRKYLVLHGGLFSDDNITLDDIRKLNRQNQPQPGQSGLMMEMLWTDPQPVAGRAPSKRGMGLLFGPDVTKRFCEKNGLEAIIRSHEVRMNGYEVEHDGRCITVFSAPKYCDTTENKGAFINLGSELKLEYHVFEAVPHPDIKPMAYAQNSLLSMMM